MGKIIVPDSVAKELQQEAAAKQKAETESRRRADLHQLTKELQRTAGQITDPTAIAAIRKVCGKLLNTRPNAIAPIGLAVSWDEIGRLLSDALLGYGQEYEIKT